MKKNYSNKKAFTMVELSFVIIILGIVSSIGAEIIADIYESYIVQRAQQRSSAKTDLSTTQIANRLRYAIPGTVYRITDTGSYESIESPLSTSGDNYIGLQWVAADGDSFEALKDDATAKGRRPGWSGFCDLDQSTQTNLNSPGSNFAIADAIIKNLSKDTAGASKFKLADASVFFPGSASEYNVSSSTGTADYENNLTLESGTKTFVEQYKLAWSSYALIVKSGDLYLYYNFEPTPKTSYSNQPKQLLMKNVSTFKFKASGQTIRFKVCKEERISDEYNITSCKEKAVF